jgi:hypothetical protein
MAKQGRPHLALLFTDDGEKWKLWPLAARRKQGMKGLSVYSVKMRRGGVVKEQLHLETPCGFGAHMSWCRGSDINGAGTSTVVRQSRGQ